MTQMQSSSSLQNDSVNSIQSDFSSVIESTKQTTFASNSHLFSQILQDLLAPITPDSFQSVIGEVKQNLQFLKQMLALLEETEFESLLFELLRTIPQKLGELLAADRSTIFLLDETKQELWSIVAEETANKPLEIRIPANSGIAGYVAQQEERVNIPFDFYDDPRSTTAKTLDQKNGYRTYSLLTMPLKTPQGKVIGVVQLLNKCHIHASTSTASLAERIDRTGFTTRDEDRLAEFSDAIALLLESYQAFYLAAQRQRASAALMRATQYLFEANLNWEETLQRVLDEAKTLIYAQHSDLWLIDSSQRGLYRPLKGRSQEPLLPLNSPILGQVASSGQVICLNSLGNNQLHQQLQIDFAIDNLLCLPLWNHQQEIIGVTLLLNKCHRPRPAIATQENFAHRPAHFAPNDEAFMAVFNRHAGLALERARQFQEMERQVLKRTAELEHKHQCLRQEILERKRVEETLQKVNQQLQELVRVDELTQIDNRRHFEQQFLLEWKRMGREKLPLSVILCDVDFFKRYNDHYGHPAGDRCLYQVAQTIRTTVKRPADVVARYGGEEFIVLLPNTPAIGALHLANCIRREIAALQLEHCQSEQYGIVTLSLGVACQTPDRREDHRKALIQKADEGLYQAKQQGRNQAVLTENN